MNNELSTVEIEDIAAKLSRLSPGYLPFPLFIEFTRLWVTAVVELFIFRTNDGVVEVLLDRRHNDDPHWGGQLHVPGTVVRPSDRKGDFSDAIERIFKQELSTEPIRVYPVQTVFRELERGSEVATIFYCDATATQISTGDYYPVENVPTDFIQSQHKYLQMSLKAFNTERTKR